MKTAKAKHIHTFLWLSLVCLHLVLGSCKKDTDPKPGDVGSVTDVEGNVYQTVTINGLTWMTENLRVTRYRNGDNIDHLAGSDAWTNAQAGAYCHYENAESNALRYGCLYNWSAVNDARGLAPAGWHVASFTEWENLMETAGGRELAGGALKQEGTSEWEAPNLGASNTLHFNALPAGLRDEAYTAPFYHAGLGGYWWTSTNYDILNASCWYVLHDEASIFESLNGKNCGLSVRCVKD